MQRLYTSFNRRGKKERRRANRLEGCNLQVELEWNGQVIHGVRCVDVTSFGMGVLSENSLPLRQRIRVTLEEGKIRVADIQGKIVNETSQDEGFRYGIEFYATDTQRTALFELESALRQRSSGQDSFPPSS